ncbi:MAG: hypothetical protein Q8O03_00935 [Nanoarchaeota archaeon]|nr:hypothetical protein [Nanoarchaeota archaeon]
MINKIITKKSKHDCDSKKAIAPIIATVLLLGFAIALGTGVYLWQVRQTESLSKGLVRFASGILDCQNVNFNAYSSDGCTKVSIKNSGFFDVDGFVIRSFSSFGVGGEVEEVFVKAQGSTVLEVGLVDAEKVEVMPVVKVEGELIGCKDVVRKVACTGLDDIQKEACNSADNKGTCNLLDGLGIVTCQECYRHLGKCGSC